MLLLSWGAVAIQTTRLNASEAAYDALVAAGKAQEAVNRKKAEGDAKLKKEKDDEAKRRIAAAESRAAKLLSGAGRVELPRDPAPGSADLACFDRAQFLGAINQFLGEVAGLALEGDKAAIGLDASRSWVAELLRRQ